MKPTHNTMKNSKNHTSKADLQRVNETIVAKANYSKRTFTIKKYIDGRLYATYSTIQLSKDEFNSELNNTENDWKQFLKSDDYYRV
jgi:hypothetical protein